MILKGVSFQLGAGEFLGVIGPSGAGKTTLAKVLVGILQLRGGDARLDGAELSSWHPDDLGRHIGYVPQDVQLFPGTVRENIARMARESDPDDVIHAAKLAGVHETVLALPDGYDTDIGEAGYLLSAGQRQHIALARAFYGDPSILVLDEPNSNLDSVSESALVRALSAAKERGITLVVVTHRPNILEAADKLLLLRDGSVELYGPRVEILTRMQQAAIEHGQRRKLSVVDENPKSEGDRKKAVRSKRRSKKAAASEALPVSEHDSRPKKASPSAQPASDERTAPQPPKRAHGPASESGNRAVVTAEQAAEPVGKPERFVESSIVRADRSLIETDDPVVTGGKVNDRL
jgi:ABC-type multidrug transport system ATPase subunit